jgi:hypothetical protein
VGVAGQLAQVLRDGVRLDFGRDPERPIFRCADGDRPRVERVLTPEAKPEVQRLLRHAAQYRQHTRALFTRHPSWQALLHDPEWRRHRVEERRLIDELGLDLAVQLMRAIAQEWFEETGRCGFCGGATYCEIQAEVR